jgi:hypothetical protein
MLHVFKTSVLDGRKSASRYDQLKSGNEHSVPTDKRWVGLRAVLKFPGGDKNQNAFPGHKNRHM